MALATCLAVSGCVRPTDAAREGDLAALHRSRLLADGVTPSDSARFGAPQDSLILLPAGGGTRVVGSRSVSALTSLLEDVGRCGVDSTTLPRGVRLLPTFFEFTYRLSPYRTPVQDAKAASPPQPVCGPTIAVSPNPRNLATSDYPTRVQREPLDVRFDSAVTGVGIYGLGALKCYPGSTVG